MTATALDSIAATIRQMMTISGANDATAANIAEIVTTIINDNPKALTMIANPATSEDTITALVSKAFEIRRHALQRAIDNPAEFAAFTN